VEKKTKFFKFFIDFDLLTETIIDECVYIKCIQEVLYEIYKIKELKCIVTTADKFLNVVKNDKKYYKQGFHFHWPELVVDNETALDIRHNIVTIEKFSYKCRTYLIDFFIFSIIRST
jgi:hypothetical protein